MRVNILSAVLLIAATIIPGTIAAQDRPIKLQGEVHLLKPGTEGAAAELVDAEGVVPGDTLVFTTTYRNDGSETVTDFTIMNPVSPELLLSEETAHQTEVSVDGGNAWGNLASLSVANEEGEARPATPQDITHMRWIIREVLPATVGEVRFSATVR